MKPTLKLPEWRDFDPVEALKVGKAKSSVKLFCP